MMAMKSNSTQRMYLAGLQAQSSVYGATIPVYYGTTKGTPLLIWLPGVWLRKGDGLSGSKKSSSLGGPPNYIDNADFLIGHNPIAGVLRFWYNNTSRSLHFTKYTSSHAATSNGFSITVPDSLFYFVMAVTANIPYSVTFNDYGSQGSVTLSGTYEVPLWNVNYAGPDPTNQSGYKYFPAVYQWIPYSSATLHFPPGAVFSIPGAPGTVTINVYYAQLEGIGYVPANEFRLTFEPQCGQGDAYGTYAGAPRFVYPEYAGMWALNLDMGLGGTAPAIAQETVGSFSYNAPSGDADHADMIEDIFKSGPAQAGTGAAVAYGDIHHGLGCLDFPGTIQKKFVSGGASGLTTATYDLPNTAGNFLICVVNSQTTGITISDSAGNIWIPLIPGTTSKQIWYCTALAAASNTITLSAAGVYTQVTLLEIAGLDTSDGSFVVTTGTGGTYSASIPTSNKAGEDALVLSFLSFDPGSLVVQPVTYHWKGIINPLSGAAVNGFYPPSTVVQSRATKFPGTYSQSFTIGGSTTWVAVLMAFKNSQPNSFTSPLGNILDDATLQVARAGAKAYGLIGSAVLDSQKKASDYLKEWYQVMNAAPVWSGDKLKSIAYAEQSFAGNGAIYTSPTSAGPVANLTEDDFITEGTNPPVTVSRSAQVDALNLQQIQCPIRPGYDVGITSQPDNGSMSLYGTRKDSPKVFQSIQSTVVARMILGIMVRETNIIRNTYKFKLQGKWALFEAMDLITIPLESTMPSVNLPTSSGFQA